jgi:hypothetical protein
MQEHELVAFMQTPTGRRKFPIVSSWTAHEHIAANAKSLVDAVGTGKNSHHKRALVNALSRDLPAQQAAEMLGVERRYVYHSRAGKFDVSGSNLLTARYSTNTTRVKVPPMERTRIASFVEGHTITPSGAATARKILEQFQYEVYTAYRTKYVAQLRLMMNEGLCVRTSVRAGKRKPNILEMNVLALQLSDRPNQSPVCVASVGEGWTGLKLSVEDEAVANWKLRPRDKDTFWAIAREEVSFVRSKKASHCNVCDEAPSNELRLQALNDEIYRIEGTDDHSQLPKLKQDRRLLKNKVQRGQRHIRMLNHARVKAKERELALKPGEVMVLQDFGALYKLDGSKAVNLIFTLIYRTVDEGPLHIRYIDNWCTDKGQNSEVLCISDNTC